MSSFQSLIRSIRKFIPAPLLPRKSPALRKALGKLAVEARKSAEVSRESSDAIANKLIKLNNEYCELRTEASAADGIAQTLEERGLL